MFSLGGGSIYRLLNKNIKEFNKIKLSIICIVFLLSVGFTSYKINSSYALFSDSIIGEKTIEVIVNPSANEPVLDSGMIPVYYDENTETWKKADKNNSGDNWYNYNKKKWANSVTVSSTNRSKYLSASVGTEIPMDDILTMQVWIPRYKYKVWNYNTDGTNTSTPKEIDITFEEEKNKTGEISCSDNISGKDGDASETCKLKGTNEACTDSTCNKKTYTHPAFTFGDKEINGFWVGKFQISGISQSNITQTSNNSNAIYAKKLAGDLTVTDTCVLYDGSHTEECSNLDILDRPNIYILDFNYIKNIFNMSKVNNIYGLKSNTDTHMIKNIEWGAVAYLSYSRYGTCEKGICTEVTKNHNNSRTGMYRGINETSEYSVYEYNTPQAMSTTTTGNIYGVYDMSGGYYEYTMTGLASEDGKTIINQYTSYTLNEKHYDKYSYGTSPKSLKRGKLGDGTKEVVSGEYGWYESPQGLGIPTMPWVKRGGSNLNPEVGIFASYVAKETSDGNSSTRFIITP